MELSLHTNFSKPPYRFPKRFADKREALSAANAWNDDNKEKAAYAYLHPAFGSGWMVCVAYSENDEPFGHLAE